MATEPRMATVLALDIGNTHVSYAAVWGEQVYTPGKIAIDHLEDLPAKLTELWSAMDKPRRVVACSVNPEILKKVKAASMEAIEEPIVVVGQDVPVSIKTTLQEPQQVGVDRLLRAAAAAYGRLGQACVVVDLGTAVTIDCVDDDGVFRGGVILPGAGCRRRHCVAGRRSFLKCRCAEPNSVFGKNTEEAIIGGIVYGLRGAIREHVEAYATELSEWPLVILTGGDAGLIKMDEGFVQATVPELVPAGRGPREFYESLVPEETQAQEEGGGEEEEDEEADDEEADF